MAHSSAAPLKSILKKALVKAPGPSPPTGPSKPERDQETALYHARLIQEQKDAEVEIFNAIERLIELPSSSQADPAHPSMADVALVLRDVSLFQPSDYDALIEERNINQSCGYLLCPRPRRMEDTPAKFRIVRGKARGEEFRVLRKAELERWCSRDCAMRALHLRVQLSDAPAWTRDVTADASITLYREGHGDDSTRSNALTTEAESLGLVDDFIRLDLEDGDRSTNETARALAVERGDKPAAQGHVPVEVSIQEKEVSGAASPPSTANTTGSNAHLQVEGYEPGWKPKKGVRVVADEGNTDWEI